MKSSLGAITKAQRRRLEIIKFHVGCLACRRDHDSLVPAEAHHLLSGGRRISHDATVPLCPWHHRGACNSDAGSIDMEILYGPSLALSKRKFHELYGTDEEMLDETNRRVKEFESRTIGGTK